VVATLIEFMDYTLAKKLKDAGFPQNVWDFELANYAYDDVEELHLLHYDNDTGWLVGNDYDACERDGIEWTRVPTLSELIDACGEDFESLLKTNTKEGCEWSARGYNYPTTGYLSQETAVANLWLAINK